MSDIEATPEEKRLKELELKNYNLEREINDLKLINVKLGYSTKIMSEYHLTIEDKLYIANSMDLAQKAEDVAQIYQEYKKMLHNKALDKEGFEDFQMSEGFKDNLISYLSVSIGENPVESLSINTKSVKEYFDLENKIRSTPDGGQRNAMTERLLKMRPNTIDALNTIINTVNELNKSKEYEDS